MKEWFDFLDNAYDSYSQSGKLIWILIGIGVLAAYIIIKVIF
jgi:hypothetical protein